MWPGVSDLPDFKDTFPKWPRRSLAERYPQAEPALIDLLERTLAYDPARRISAKQAMQHPYFDDVRNSIEAMSQPTGILGQPATAQAAAI